MDGKKMESIGRYRLERRLNDNDDFQAWIATDRNTDRRVFLKILPGETAESNKPALEIVKSSFRLQSRIKSSLLLGASAYNKIQNNLIVEYPYLAEHDWKTLDIPSLLENIKKLLPEICLALDFIHTRNLVHGDIKLANFMVSLNSHSGHRVKLTDLDFLSINGKEPAGLIFGTPDHLAPEMVENRIIDNRSDNYSLGRALLNALNRADLPDSEYMTKLKGFAESLASEPISERPENLGNHLFEMTLLDERELQDYNRRLLSMQLIAAFHEYKNQLYDGSLSFKEFFVDNNNVWNISLELYSDLERLPKYKALKLLEALIRNASIERFGEYWRVNLTQEQLREFYSTLDFDKDLKPFPLPDEKEECRAYMDRLVLFIREAEKNRAVLKQYLYLSQKDNSIPDDLDSGRLELAESGFQFVLAGFKETLVDYQGALQHYQNISNLPYGMNCFRRDAMYKIAFRKLAGRRTSEVLEMIEKFRTEAETDGDSKFILRRLEAYVLMENGKLDEALEAFEKNAESLSREVSPGYFIRTLSDISAVYGRSGNRREAVKYLQDALKIARSDKLEKEYMGIAINLSINYDNMGDYDKSIAFAKKAINKSQSSGNTVHLPIIYGRLINTLIKRGDFHKSRYWLNQYRLSGSQVSSHSAFSQYYIFKGYLFMKQGLLKEAELALTNAETIAKTYGDPDPLITVNHDRALISLYRGNHSLCDEYIERGLKHARDLKRNADVVALNVLSVLNGLYRGEEIDIKRTSEIMELLASNRQSYYLALITIHLIINEIKLEPGNSPDLISCYRQINKDKKTPLFAALSRFVTVSNNKIRIEPIDVAGLKAAMKQAEAAGHLFMKAVICYKLGMFYARDGYDKLSGKFWKYGRDVAQQIRNDNLIRKFDEAAREQHSGTVDRSETIQTVLRISEVFKNMDDYEESVSNLVEFAVKETGAERGVLLLYPHEQTPRIEAYYNIDNDSLKDVMDFSMNIPKKSITDFRPLIIEDASKNKYTESYKSIFRHNIRSVISIPLQVTDTLKGALYLDHHSIPALFDKGDISFALSMANFISVLLNSLRNYRKIRVERNNFSEEVRASGVHNEFITEDPKALDMLRMIPTIAPTNANILILGESGTGKEIIAELIHRKSGRKDGPLIKINCAAVTSSLMEAELFGIAKNAASGVSQKEGKIAAADGGTLFIDEIGDMPHDMQAKILRAIENHEFYRIGDNRLMNVNVRFVYATNRDLRKLVDLEKFRQDLLYRINTVTIKVPPLRKRKSDIPLLLEHFLNLFAQNYGAPPVFSEEAVEALKIYQWPGNVRELKNLAEKYAILYHGREVGVEELPEEIKLEISREQSKSSTDSELKARIIELLVKHNGNQSKVARIMGMSLSTLRRKIKKFGI